MNDVTPPLRVDGGRTVLGKVRSRLPSRRVGLLLIPLAPLAYLLLSFLGSPRRAQYWGRAEHPGREHHPLERMVLAEAAVRPGMHVADIGAGGGFYTFRFARDVGPEGLVVATDIDPDMVAQLHVERVWRAAFNVIPRRADEDDPGLEPSRFDLVVIVNTYQFRDCRPERNRLYLRALARALRPGGRVIIADGFVHRAGWVSPHGDRPLECGNLPPAELSAIAAPDLVTRRALPRLRPAEYRYAPHEEPGYMMVLERP